MIDKVLDLSKNTIVERAYKTFVEVTAAQAALYTTVVPTTPGVRTSAAISVGATVLSVVWNGLLLWATNAKSAKLDKLAQAIDDIVDQRLAAQAAQQKQAVVPQHIPEATSLDLVSPVCLTATHGAIAG